MNEIVKLYKEHPVRIVDRGGEPWFVAKDVCAVLEIAKVDSAIRSLDEDEKDTHSMSTLGGDQELSIVSEAGLYSLVLRSRKPEAKAFKRWVTHEVLPSIRKTGAYVAPNLSMEQISAVVRKLGAMANQLITENAGLRYRYLPPATQVVLISATLPHEILEMTNKFMTDPIRILVKR